MSRDWRLFRQDIVDACEKVQRYTRGLDFSDFVANELVFDAVLRNLEVIGEAAKKVPEDVRRRHPEVEWRSIAGLWDILTHAYFAIDNPTLWDIVRWRISLPLQHVRSMVEEER